MTQLKPEDLQDLESAILTHVVSRQGRKRCVIKYLFDAVRTRGSNKNPISTQELSEACPGDSSRAGASSAFRTMIKELKQDLTLFYGSSEGQSLPYRMTWDGNGNYLPKFLPNTIKDFVPLFWAPYLGLDKKPRLMYPEPFFVIDHTGTNLRNSAVNTIAEKHKFSYLTANPPLDDGRTYADALETGYSYIPAGIVQGMFFVVNALARHAKNSSLEAEAVMPSLVRPLHSDELILLATPTSIGGIVDTLESGLRMRTTAKGIRIDDDEQFEDKEDEGPHLIKWGLLTREQNRNRTVTVISANHGRTVEAIAQALTNNKQLAELAKQLPKRYPFRSSFQTLFRVRMKKTREGPCIDGTWPAKTFLIEDRDDY
jgi:hypothetical protein